MGIFTFDKWLLANPFGDEMRIVPMLDGRRSVSIVHERFRRKVVGCAVQVRNGRCGHGMLVGRRVVMERISGEFRRRAVFLYGEIGRISSGSAALKVAHGHRYPIVSGLRGEELRISRDVAKRVGIVPTLIEHDLLPGIRREGSGNGRPTY